MYTTHFITVNPEITIASHINGDFENESFTISGTAADDEGVTSMSVSTDNGVTWDTNVNTSNDYAVWTYDVNVSVNENMYFRIRAQDSDGNESYSNLYLRADVSGPDILFFSPATGSTVNGTVLLQGTATDNGSSVTNLELRIGAPDE